MQKICILHNSLGATLRRFRSNRPRSTTRPYGPSSTNPSDDLASSAVGNRQKGLELDLHLREFEINQLTQRNNFFMIFQGMIIAGLVQSQGTAAPIINFGVAFLGMTTSVLQMGMAGGAKYWQSRWEASTRSSEIEIVLELVKRRKLAVQTFTHDISLLTPDEQKKIADWNAAQTDPDEMITDGSRLIQQKVIADINCKSNSETTVKRARRYADWWVRKFAIEPKWSVSRIPIWVGAALFVFWLLIALHSLHIEGIAFSLPAWLSLVPLKNG